MIRKTQKRWQIQITHINEFFLLVSIFTSHKSSPYNYDSKAVKMLCTGSDANRFSNTESNPGGPA